MKLSKENIEILIVSLEERYRSIHTIRDRIQNMTVWLLGLLVAGSGWFYQSEKIYSCNEKTFLILAILLIWFSLRSLYFADLEKGFNSQRQAAAGIEIALGLYKDGVFCDSTIYPLSWKKSGQKGSEGKFVKSNYNLIAIGFGLLVVTIFLKGIFL